MVHQGPKASVSRQAPLVSDRIYISQFVHVVLQVLKKGSEMPCEPHYQNPD